MESLWVPPTCGSNSFRINDEPALKDEPFQHQSASVLSVGVGRIVGWSAQRMQRRPGAVRYPFGAASHPDLGTRPSPRRFSDWCPYPRTGAASHPDLGTRPSPRRFPDWCPYPRTGQPPSPTSAPALVPGGSPTGVPTQEPGQPPSPTSAPALVPGGSPTGVPAQESVPDSRFGPGVYAFSLPSAQGPEVSLSQYLGERHVVLVFYRAWW